MQWIRAVVSKSLIGVTWVIEFQLRFFIAQGGLFIHPSFNYNSLHTDLWNPWVTWCQNINAPDLMHRVLAGCTNTGWYRIGGPYSLMWYWTMIAFSLNGLIGFFWIPLLIEQYQMIRLYKIKPVWGIWLFYVLAMTYTFFTTAQNMLIMQIITLTLLIPKKYPKYVRLLPIIVAVLYKLPIGAPIEIWRYAFGSSVIYLPNYISYSLLGVWCLICFEYVRRSKTLEK